MTTSPPARTPAPGPAHPGVAASPPDGGRLRRWAWPVAVGLGLLLVTVLSVVVSRPPSSLPLAPDNPRPSGGRAAAQILAQQGVEITVRRTAAGAADATRPGGTIFVTHPAQLSATHWDLLLAAPADLVLTNVAYSDLSPLTEALEPSGEGGDGERRASCADADARAAGTLVTRSGDVRAVGPDVVVCFPPAAGSARSGGERSPGEQGELGAYAVVTEGGRTIRVLADGHPVTNAGLAEAGNAALVLRSLGRTPHLTWYLPSPTDTGARGADGRLTPPVVPVLGAWALLVALAVMLWRGRRLGPLATEPLPVVVPPAETTRGRARLYRRARAHRHAAAALRAGTAYRLARRVGVAESAGPDALVAALSRATGRPSADVAALLYGPAPEDDAGLARLTRALDALEAEVRP